MQFEGRKVVIDLDDTLSNLRDEVMVEFNRITGQNQHWSSWEYLKVEDLYGVGDFLGVAYEHKLLERARPHGETVSFMNRLFDHGFDVTILTARGWHHRGKELTEHWLGLYHLPYSRVVVCDLEECKSDYIRKMDDVLFVIDDSMSHCNRINALKDNRPEFVFSYAMPWNKNVDEGVIRINNLHQIETYIEGF